MPNVKLPRKSTAVDMTAMCDVAFLLLSFFILAAKFKPPERGWLAPSRLKLRPPKFEALHHGLLDSYAFIRKQEYFNKSQAASSSWMTLRMDASAL